MNMYRAVGALFAVAFLLNIFVSQITIATGWEGSYASLDIVDVGQTQLASPNNACPTLYAYVDIDTIGEKQACMWGGTRSVISYYNGSRFSLAASGFGGIKRYTIQNICINEFKCIYSPTTDTLVEVGMGAYPTKQITVTRNVMRDVKWRFDKVSAKPYLQYEGRNSSHVITDVDGRPISVEAVNVSDNGKWLGVELLNAGTGIVDMDTLQVRRIHDGYHPYGYGMNPSQEIAVSDDGTAVMIAGINSGFKFITIDKNCGEQWRYAARGAFTQSVTRCEQGDLGIGYLLWGVRMYHKPRFIGSMAIVYAQTKSVAKIFRIQSKNTQQTVVPYIALGDSFTSGEGETSDTRYLSGTNELHERCHISSRSYPYLLIPEARSVACSGARTLDIVGAASYAGQNDRLTKTSDTIVLQNQSLTHFTPGRIPQLNFVQLHQPKIVTVGIGGNDAGLMEKLRSCVSSGTCEWARPEMLEKTALEIQALSSKLIETYIKVAEAAPSARHYIIGYPDVIRESDTCEGITGFLLNAAEREYLKQSLRYLNQVIEASANIAGLHYVDTQQSFGTSALCQQGNGAAMNGIRFGDDASPVEFLSKLRIIGSESFHPTPRGHELLAARIRTQTNSLTMPVCGVICAGYGYSSIPSPGEYWKVSKDSTRAVLVVAAKNRISKADTVLDVSLPLSPFKPSSEVSISLNETVLRTDIPVQEQTTLLTKISLPKILDEGAHVLHIYGESVEGGKIDAYQEVVVESEKQASSVTAHIMDDSLKELAPNVLHSNEVSKDNKLLTNLPAATLSSSPKIAEMAKKRVESSSQIHIIIIAATAIGIIVLCLPLVLLSRK